MIRRWTLEGLWQLWWSLISDNCYKLQVVPRMVSTRVSPSGRGHAALWTRGPRRRAACSTPLGERRGRDAAAVKVAAESCSLAPVRRAQLSPPCVAHAFGHAATRRPALPGSIAPGARSTLLSIEFRRRAAPVLMNKHYARQLRPEGACQQPEQLPRVAGTLFSGADVRCSARQPCRASITPVCMSIVSCGQPCVSP